MTTPVTDEAENALKLREAAYRYVNAILLVLLGIGTIGQTEVALWGELGLGVVTLVFALTKATSSWRIALYGILAPVSAVLGYLGIAQGFDWGLIGMAVAQVLGITTAAAKVVTLPKDVTRAPLVA